MKRFGLISALGLSLMAAPGAALATGWGGHPTTPPPRVYAPPPAYVVPTPRAHVVPVRQRYVGAHTRIWVPAHWGLRGGSRVFVAGTWSFPPFAGWVWITPRWAWNGYGWVWQEGQWAPPVYGGY
jgi:YXWGXW repeat-containing protein